MIRWVERLKKLDRLLRQAADFKQRGLLFSATQRRGLMYEELRIRKIEEFNNQKFWWMRRRA